MTEGTESARVTPPAEGNPPMSTGLPWGFRGHMSKPSRCSVLRGQPKENHEMISGIVTKEQVAERVEAIARQDLQAVLSQWREVIGDVRVTTADIIGRAETRGADMMANPEFRKALVAVSGRGGMLSAKVLGKWLQAHQDKTVDGATIVRLGTRHHVAIWALRA
jgi:hypothetical protein